MTISIRHLAPLALAALAGTALANPAPAAPATAERTATAAPATAPATRDWNRIDTDRDGYISAAEMQAYLVAEQTRQRNTTVATK
ncbi:hypothetical protein KAK07_24685 [Ideonella sp. 4Y16]|uniref:EF-hand domain-containing protein n=1 Tax=Ideonella alba TaxID=2824118 RepID=A0A940YNU1_9BURK|nr:EF-hand domain-containing protein [Ideonella alba]MBQ0933119.1 hypothetical protein [Ideonella alba]MBQ0946551.1 hypothetical protein [Ideonella alba]